MIWEHYLFAYFKLFFLTILKKIILEAKNLVLNLLTPDVSKRFKAIEILSDDWIRLFNQTN